MPHLEPLADDALPKDVADYWASIAEGMPDAEVPGLYRLLAHNACLVEAVHRFARSLFLDSGLDPVTRQLVIHRTVFLERCSHAWHQHLRVSSAIGVEHSLIRALGRWRTADIYTSEQAAALAATDEIVLGADNPAPAPRLAADLLVAVQALAGFYIMVSRLINACGLAAPSPVVWPDDGECS